MKFDISEISGILKKEIQQYESKLDVAKVDDWIGKGAQLSPTVKRLLIRARNAQAV